MTSEHLLLIKIRTQWIEWKILCLITFLSDELAKSEIS